MSRDRRRFLTGEGRYTADLAVAETAHAAFVRSDVAHARLVEVATEEAKALPGVLAVLVAADFDGVKGFPSFLRYPDIEGRAFAAPPRPIFALDRVRHVGEIIAMVVAKTAAIAQDAAELVRVRYDELPATTGWSLAGQAVEAPIHEAYPDNIAFRGLFGDPAACRAAEERAAHVVELTVALPRVSPTRWSHVRQWAGGTPDRSL